MCHPWQQYLEHLKLEWLLGSLVLVGLAIKIAHKHLKHVGYIDQNVGRCTKAVPLLAKVILFLGHSVKNSTSFLSLNIHR